MGNGNTNGSFREPKNPLACRVVFVEAMSRLSEMKAKRDEGERKSTQVTPKQA